jgi:hypothetical protein
MSNLAISVEDVGKQYNIFKETIYTTCAKDCRNG